MNLLIDSAKFIDWQRAGTDPREVLVDRVLRGDIFICGVVRAEVVRGIRNPRWRRDLEEFLDLVPEVPTNRDVWTATADLAWKLGRKGDVLPLTDIVIAVCALRIGAAVVSSDRHFSRIPNLQVLRDLPG